uniref:Uncharacterized protein n=1 Tax=Fagus sylvatica TaxID=28930 RepID=A0A2N9GT97_FAGSY
MASTTVVQVGTTTTNPTSPAPITSSFSDLLNVAAPPSTPSFRSFSTPNHIRSGSPQSFRIHNSIDHCRLIQRSNGSATFFSVVSIPLHTQLHPQWVTSKLPHPQQHRSQPSDPTMELFRLGAFHSADINNSDNHSYCSNLKS